MVIDPNPSAGLDPAPEASPIENELPAYRAISPLAVGSVALGVVAVLSFADAWFLVAAGLAIVTGFLADRKIRLYPDLYTGRKLAQAGLAMGLVFGLSALTISTMQRAILARQATRFTEQYLTELRQGKLVDALWYRVSPEARKGKLPEELYKEFADSTTDPGIVESYIGTIRDMQQAAQAPGAEIHLVELEQVGTHRLEPYASALVEVHNPTAPETERERYGLVVLTARPDHGPNDWYVKDVIFPYVRKSHRPAEKPVDDGHGHGH